MGGGCRPAATSSTCHLRLTADGYAVLVAGLRRAEEAREAGEPWADELVRRYQLAIDNYVASYGVSLE